MTAILTGATGFIGGHLLRALAGRGEKLVVLGRRAPERPAGTDMDWVPFDLDAPGGLDRRRLAAAIGEPADARLYHVGAVIPRAGDISAAAYMRANGAASQHLFEACAGIGVGRMVYASSVAVYGGPADEPLRPTTPATPADAYGYSKLAGECAAACVAEAAGARIAILRIASPYGRGMARASILPIFVARALGGAPYGWFGSGSRAQDFVHVSDVVAALLAAADRGASGIFNVASGVPVANRDLALLVKSLTPASGSVVAPVDRPDPEEGRVWRIDVGDGSRFGWTPAVRLEDGLRDYIESLRGD